MTSTIYSHLQILSERKLSVYFMFSVAMCEKIKSSYATTWRQYAEMNCDIASFRILERMFSACLLPRSLYYIKDTYCVYFCLKYFLVELKNLRRYISIEYATALFYIVNVYMCDGGYSMSLFFCKWPYIKAITAL